MGGAVQAVTKPIVKAVGLAPSAPAVAAPAPVSAALEARQSPEDRAAGLGRAESEIQGQLAARKGRRGRASTVLGAADETAGGMTASKRLLGE
jgi:hypothetical protein